jgi:CHASE1-domain containing sensor protein
MASTGDRSGTPFVVILVALAGLLSTVGAAFLSGYWTNASVERQFEAQRNAQIYDQRRQLYVNYIKATFEKCAADETENEAEQIAKTLSFDSAYASAQLIASPEVREPMTKWFNATSKEGCGDKADPLSDAFLEAAKQELDDAG